MDAMTFTADHLAKPPEPHDPEDDGKSKTARMRRKLRQHGPMRARELAKVAGLAGSSLVGALLKYDIQMGRIRWHAGRYYWNEDHQEPARPAREGALCETLEWHEISNDDFPDADLTVIVRMRGNEEPVWLGYWDDEEWRDMDGQVIDVVRWAQMPQGGDV